jgi:hypothetical protein
VKITVVLRNGKKIDVQDADNAYWYGSEFLHLENDAELVASFRSDAVAGYMAIRTWQFRWPISFRKRESAA